MLRLAFVSIPKSVEKLQTASLTAELYLVKISLSHSPRTANKNSYCKKEYNQLLSVSLHCQYSDSVHRGF